MAVLPPPIKEEEEGAAAPSSFSLTGGAGSLVDVPEGAVAPGGPSQATHGAEASPSGQSQTGFVNLERYLQANKQGTERFGTQFGQEALKGVGGEVQQARNVLGFSGSEQDKVQTPGILQAFDRQGADYKTYKGLIEGGKAGELSPQQLQQIQGLQSGVYSGPKQLSEIGGYGEAVKEREEAMSALGQLGNRQGQGELVKEYFGDSGYTRGESALDTALLGQSETGQQGISDIQERFKGFESELGKAEQKAADTAYLKELEAGTAKDIINQSITDRLSGLTGGFEDTAAGYQDQERAAYNAALEQTNPYAALGTAFDSLGNIGIDMPDYTDFYTGQAGQGPTQVSAADVITAPQYAEYSALAGLSGTPLDYTEAGGYGGPTDYDFTGNFDQAGFDAAIAQALGGIQLDQPPQFPDFGDINDPTKIFQGLPASENYRKTEGDVVDIAQSLDPYNPPHSPRSGEDFAPVMTADQENKAGDVSKIYKKHRPKW